MTCPCGSGRDYDVCCGHYISGAERPPTAEALMRSRYTAFTRGAFDYIGSTFSPRSEAAAHAKGAREWAASGSFKRLRVLATERGGAGDNWDWSSSWPPIAGRQGLGPPRSLALRAGCRWALGLRRRQRAPPSGRRGASSSPPHDHGGQTLRREARSAAMISAPAAAARSTRSAVGREEYLAPCAGACGLPRRRGATKERRERPSKMVAGGGLEPPTCGL